LPQLGDDLLGFVPFAGHFESSFGYNTSGRITFQGEGQTKAHGRIAPHLASLDPVKMIELVMFLDFMLGDLSKISRADDETVVPTLAPTKYSAPIPMVHKDYLALESERVSEPHNKCVNFRRTQVIKNFGNHDQVKASLWPVLWDAHLGKFDMSFRA
jgi:hypothetical protein